MRNFTFVFVLFFAAVLSFAQSDQSRQAKIDSLERLKHHLTMKIQNIESEIANLRVAQLRKEVATSIDSCILIRISDTFDFVSSDNHVVKAKVGNSLELLDYEEPNFKVRYRGVILYAWKYHIYGNWMSMGFEYDEIIAIWDKWYQKLLKRKEIERIRQENERIAVEQKEARERRQYLTNKYGSKIADKLMQKKIWIGMTSEMAIDSWGRPDRNNRTVHPGILFEQWIYNDTYLYFENSILKSYQDSE